MEWSMVVLGATGMGKSNFLSRYIEQLLKNDFPFFLIDHSGEQGGLHDPEKGWPQRIRKISKLDDGTYRQVKTGREFSDVKNSCGKADAQRFCRGRQSWHLFCDEFIFNDKELLFQYIYDFVKECHEIAVMEKKSNPKAELILRPVIVDECHNYLNQGEVPIEGFKDKELPGKLKQFLITLAKEGRKYGRPLVLVSQRPAAVDKEATTQCANAVLLPVNSGPDVDRYALLLPKMKLKDMLRLMTTMKSKANRGQCFFITNEGMRFAWVKPKETPDGGKTPSVNTLIGFKYGEGVTTRSDR
jgi:hypothetical protein